MGIRVRESAALAPVLAALVFFCVLADDSGDMRLEGSMGRPRFGGEIFRAADLEDADDDMWPINVVE